MKRATYVPPSGSPNATYIVVGEQPGIDEIRSGRPFAGYSGQELHEDLRMAGINSADCYFTNVVKDADEILEKYISFHPRRGPSVTDKGRAYINQLAEEISNHPAKVIIGLGNLPLYALADRLGVSRWRGSVLECALVSGKTFIPSVSPASVWKQYTNKRLLIYDLKRAKEVAEGKWNPLTRNIIINPTFAQSSEFLRVCKMWGVLGNPIAYDIEVDIFNGEMTCISFAYTPTQVISIPFVGPEGDYFTPPQEASILLSIANILEDERIPILGQNLVFDCHYMLRKYGIKTTNIHDTMVAQKTLLPDYPVGLHFICSLYTDLPYYKDDGKYWLKGIGSWDSGWKYNALDSVVCAEAYPKQIDALIKQHNYPAYERKRLSILPYVYLMEHGIRINVATMKAAYDQLGREIEDCKVRLNKLAGKELNSNSPAQVKNYFYVEKKLPVYKNKDGKASSDEKALKRIARKGYEEASLILRIRGLTKERATFLDVNKVDTDGRMRCSYNPVGTRFSRASSSENIFGTGNNLQNQPHSVLTHFLADPYYVFYGMDLSQAENRIVAYVGRITQMIEAFEAKKDIHGLTATMMATIFYGGRLPEGWSPKSISTIGDGKKTWRDWGKKCVIGSTEILTPKGWIPISDWDHTQTELAQWDPKTRAITFTMATNLSVYQSDVIELSGRNVHVVGSPNHKVITYRKDKQLYKTTTLKSLKSDSHYGIPTCGFWGYAEPVLTAAEVRLLVAFQADGSYNRNGHRFKFNKQRKIDRIKSILKALLIPFNESTQSDGSTIIGFKGPIWLTKEFNYTILGLGREEMNIFMDELQYWDGYSTNTRKQYFSTIKSNVEWAQTIAHLCGYTALIEERKPTGFGVKPLYVLNYNNRNTHAMLGSISKRNIDGPVTVYGPEVPTGYILIRSNGKISVTGNSNHGLNYDLGYKTFSLYNEIPERDGKIIVDIYHRSYPGVRNGFHKYVQQCINKDRTLTNLMGRKTLFTDKLDDQLYKDAYACIPQGSVGDIIDQRGLNFIYYHPDPLFRNVELLIQVHDQIGFQIPTPYHPSNPVPWKDHSKILTAIKASLERPLYTHYGKRFYLPADTTMGVTLNKSEGKDPENFTPECLADTYHDCTRKWLPMLHNVI